MYIPVGGAVRVTKLTPLVSVRLCKTPEVMLVFPRCLSIFILRIIHYSSVKYVKDPLNVDT